MTMVHNVCCVILLCVAFARSFELRLARAATTDRLPSFFPNMKLSDADVWAMFNDDAAWAKLEVCRGARLLVMSASHAESLAVVRLLTHPDCCYWPGRPR